MDLKTLKHKQAMAEQRRRARMVNEEKQPIEPKVEEAKPEQLETIEPVKKPKKTSKPKERVYLVVEDAEAEAEKIEEEKLEIEEEKIEEEIQKS